MQCQRPLSHQPSSQLLVLEPNTDDRALGGPVKMWCEIVHVYMRSIKCIESNFTLKVERHKAATLEPDSPWPGFPLQQEQSVYSNFGCAYPAVGVTQLPHPWHS